MSLDPRSGPSSLTDDFDDAPQPSFEQVAKSMSRSLRFSAPCPHMQERDRQIDEGRKMARAEFGAALRREPREHVGAPPSNHSHPRADAQPARSRNRRHRNRDRAAA